MIQQDQTEKIKLNRLCESFSFGFGRIDEISTTVFKVSYSQGKSSWYPFDTTVLKFYNDAENNYYTQN